MIERVGGNMADYVQIVEAERQLRNLEAVRLAVAAHVAHLQAIKVLPAVVRTTIKTDDDAPSREELERAADPNRTFDLN